MTPYQAYQVLEAERPKTDGARRAADARLGEAAAALARLASALTHPARAVRGLFRCPAPPDRLGRPGQLWPNQPGTVTSERSAGAAGLVAWEASLMYQCRPSPPL
jgi:hypothetical protein